MRDTKLMAFQLVQSWVGYTTIFGTILLLLILGINGKGESGLKEAFFTSFGISFILAGLLSSLILMKFDEYKKLLVQRHDYNFNEDGTVHVGFKKKADFMELLIYVLIFIEVIFIDVVGVMSIVFTMTVMFFVVGVITGSLKQKESRSDNKCPHCDKGVGKYTEGIYPCVHCGKLFEVDGKELVSAE